MNSTLGNIVVLLLTIGAISAQNNGTCLPYLAECIPNSPNCCNYPMILCLPNVRNGTSCLSMFDIVNLNPRVSGLSLVLPFLQNATGTVSETIDVNGQTVYNTTETVTPPPGR